MKDERKTKAQLIEELEEARKRLAALETGEPCERSHAEARVERLNRAMGAIRYITQLIVRERDPQRLIDQACRRLVETRGYSAAWMAVFDEVRGSRLCAGAGFGKEFVEMAELLEAGGLPICAEEALAEPGAAVVGDPSVACADCPLKHAIAGLGSLAARLESEGRIYGVMSVHLPSELVGDEEEKSLVAEIAGDIAFALRDIEVERQRDRYAEIVASSQEAMAMVDREYRYLEVNASYARLVGCSAAGIVGRSVPDVVGARFFEQTLKGHMDRCLAGEIAHFETEFSIPDLRPRAVDAIYSPCRDPGGRVSAVAVCIRDVTDRKAAEEALQRSEQKWRSLVHSAPDIIMMLGRDGTIDFINRGLPGLSVSEIVGRNVRDYIPFEQVDVVTNSLERVFQAGEVIRYEGEGPGPDGSAAHYATLMGPIVHDGRVANVVMIARDITEKKQLQASLAQSDRLASMGMLAAGVAHEINNPLAYILYNLDTLAKDLPQLADSLKRCYSKLGAKLGSEGVQELVGGSFNPAMLDDMIDRTKDAIGGTERIKAIARGLGTFSRVERDEIGEVDLQYAIECAVNMAYNEIKYRARLVKDYGDVPTILASDGRISQVFLNLLVNAAHAIDEGNVEGNEIRVRTWAEEGNVLAEVSDTGEGIPPENLDRVFDAFFSTKGPGVGSGLGLSICHSIVTSYGGRIDVKSEVGRGTRFTIRLPARRDELETRREEATVEEAAASELHGRILVVDDDPGIRAAITRVLADHELITVASGEEARSLVREDDAFDVILCDMMMPKMSGMDLHRWLVGENSALAERMIFFTGGAFTPKAREYLRKTRNPTVAKPFDATALRVLVSKQIASSRASR